MIPTLVITLLVLLNGLFVAAEFAIVGAPRASLERRAAQGDRAAQAHLPAAGERVVIDGVEIEVESVVNRAVASVLAAPRAPAGAGSGEGV